MEEKTYIDKYHVTVRHLDWVEDDNKDGAHTDVVEGLTALRVAVGMLLQEEWALASIEVKHERLEVEVVQPLEVVYDLAKIL